MTFFFLSFFVLRLRLLCIYNKRKNLQRGREIERVRERCYYFLPRLLFKHYQSKVEVEREREREMIFLSYLSKFVARDGERASERARERERETERERECEMLFLKMSQIQVLLSVLFRVNCVSQSYGLAKSLSWNYSLILNFCLHLFFFFFFFYFSYKNTFIMKNHNYNNNNNNNKTVFIFRGLHIKWNIRI